MPVGTLLSEQALARHEKRPVNPGERLCPACNMSPVSGFCLLPMNLGALDRAVALRKQSAAARQVKQADKLKFAESQAEASYLLLSHGTSAGSMSTENDYQRTGRWTEDEVVYTVCVGIYVCVCKEKPCVIQSLSFCRRVLSAGLSRRCL